MRALETGKSKGKYQTHSTLIVYIKVLVLLHGVL